MGETYVIGAGLTGVTTAYYLAKSGHKVIVIENNPEPAHSEHCASHANGGQISVSHAEPWANPGVLPKMLSWIGKKDAPLLWHWNLDPDQWRWGMNFLYQCLPFNWERNIKDIVNLATYSRKKLQQLVEEENIEYDRVREGIIHFYENEKEWVGAQKATEVLKKYGCNRVAKTGEELSEIEYALKDSDQIIGGTITWEDESGDAEKFTKRLADICRDKYGVKFEFNTAVQNIGYTEGGSLYLTTRHDTVQYRFPNNIVICAGWQSPTLTQKWGERLNIFPAKGYSMTVDIIDDHRAPLISLTDDEYKMVFSRLGNRLRVAGTAEFGADHDDIDGLDYLTRLKPLADRTIELFGMSTFDWSTVKYWTGLRPATPSNVPYIGESRKMEGVYFNTGHGTLGWTMACGSGQAVTDIVNGFTPNIDFSWYR